LVPSTPAREVPPLLCCLPACPPALGDDGSPSYSGAVFSRALVEALWVRSHRGLGSTKAPAARELCHLGAGMGHPELLWDADGQTRIRSSPFWSDSILPAASQQKGETVLPLQGEGHEVDPRAGVPLL